MNLLEQMLTKPETPIKRQVFYSFHFDNDCWRATMVRQIGSIDGNPPTSPNEWENKRLAGDGSIRSWIDGHMRGCSCVVVLVGRQTVDGGGVRKWIRYEIEKAWNDRKGLLGIQIHNLKDQYQNQDLPGQNPFDWIQFQGGVPMSSIVQFYGSGAWDSQATYNYIKQNIAWWIESAIATRQLYL